MGWFEALERDIMHFVTCTMHDETLGRMFASVQSDKLGIPLILLCLAFYGSWDARKAWRAVLAIGVGVGVGMLIAGTLWAVIPRKRPPHHYETLLRTPAELATCASNPEALAVRSGVSKRRSFPSRHATTVGVGVAVFWCVSRLLGSLATVYGLMVLVGRVYISKHWPSDMLAGCAIGVVCGLLAWRYVPPLLRRLRFDQFGTWVGESTPWKASPSAGDIQR
ncbi:MAG: phosphatase PAP2 family protein [Planctomycetota bacterium]|nr:phosphatase PAP2 family protein [Planctomycetota bacterium]